jgi:hypothetical protein
MYFGGGVEMNQIFAQALAPWTPQAPTKTDLVTRALILGLTAPDAERAQECADLAEYWAQGLTDAEVERCKAEAMKYV